MNISELKESYGTLSETINSLVKLGYSHDFNIQEDCLVCHGANLKLSPDEFQIDKVYRFEGFTDPDDQSILYVISSPQHNVKGTLVNGYGISADEATSKVIEKLETNQPHIPMKAESKDPQLTELNLSEFIAQIKSGKSWISSDRGSATIFKSDTMRMVIMGLHANAELKAHKANGMICVQVLEGKMEFSTDRQSVSMGKGQMIALDENVMHSVKAVEESFFLLTLVVKG